MLMQAYIIYIVHKYNIAWLYFDILPCSMHACPVALVRGQNKAILYDYLAISLHAFSIRI